MNDEICKVICLQTKRSKINMSNDRSKSVELNSFTIKAGHRVYFVDAKEDSRGNRFLALSECKSSTTGMGVRDRQRIHIYQEDIEKIFDALGASLADLGYKLELTPLSASEERGQNGGDLSHFSLPSLDEIIQD